MAIVICSMHMKVMRKVGLMHTDILYNLIERYYSIGAAIALLDSDDRSGSTMGLDAPLHGFWNPSWTICDELLS